MIDFGEYLPDLPAANNPGLVTASGCLPRSLKSYGPLSSLTVYSNALDARCQGAIAARSAAGNVTSFAGDATKLYTLSGPTFSAVNTGFTTAAEETWRFAQIGEQVVATNFADEIKVWELDASTSFAQLDSAAPRARHVMGARGFLVTGNTVDSTDGARPGRVWWSAFGDIGDFPTPGSSDAAAKQSDFQDLTSGGWVQGLVGAVGGADAIVFCDTAVYRMQYSGPPTAFEFFEIERARGTPAPNSIINVGRFAAYLGEDGFYLNDGAGSTQIGSNKVDKTLFAALDQSNFHRITAAADPINKLLIWSYPVGGSGGDGARLLVFNWELGRWSSAEVECQMIYRALSQGYTMETLDDYGTDLDALPFSLDSRVWTGGRLVLAAFDTSNRLSFFTGDALAATLETGEFVGDRRQFVSGLRPIIDGGTVTASVGYRDTPSGSVSYTTPTSAGADGICPQRISTRYARARFQIASGGSWSHAGGFEPVMRAEGRR